MINSLNQSLMLLYNRAELLEKAGDVMEGRLNALNRWSTCFMLWVHLCLSHYHRMVVFLCLVGVHPLWFNVDSCPDVSSLDPWGWLLYGLCFIAFILLRLRATEVDSRRVASSQPLLLLLLMLDLLLMLLETWLELWHDLKTPKLNNLRWCFRAGLKWFVRHFVGWNLFFKCVWVSLDFTYFFFYCNDLGLNCTIFRWKE